MNKRQNFRQGGNQVCSEGTGKTPANRWVQWLQAGVNARTRELKYDGKWLTEFRNYNWESIKDQASLGLLFGPTISLEV
jgi:hypothetical protein